MTSHILHVYVMSDCRGCERAQEIAHTVQSQVAGIDVHILDLAEHPAPPEVFSVPTYLLDGTVISLGNPDPGALIARLSRLGGMSEP